MNSSKEEGIFGVFLYAYWGGVLPEGE